MSARALPMSKACLEQRNKILRVGVIRDGKIIEERHIRHPSAVTIGQDGTNTFVIPASELPASFPVFENRNGAVPLLFTDR